MTHRWRYSFQEEICCTNFVCFFYPIDLGGQFTEDGSFIGQYVPGKINPPISPQPIHHPTGQQPSGSGSVATYV